MRNLLICSTLILGAGSTTAADLPPGLTEKEVAEGWIALFDGESTFGWTTKGSVAVEKGVLLVGGKEAARIETTSEFGPAEVLATFDGGKKKLGLSHEGGPVVLVTEPGKEFAFTSVKLRPLKMTSLFNGKDLSGWKINPGERYKSTFRVSEEGTIEVKNGPGDLQTEGQWANFLLQLQCRVNGEHLNSGVFFRCIPDEYQQGYEAQIRNEWMGDDRTKPVDFGTGAIYRRQAARKVVASDKEWFTLTLLANGNHIATWVDGYQVADFTDTREKADNARQGTKLGKGAISFQGHDPTTDLSFRNIRIAPLPE